LWLVSHEVITSGSPTEQFEICVSGAYFRGIWFPECGGHVTDRHTWRWRQGRVLSQQPQISGCSLATTVCMTIFGRGERLAARQTPQRPEPLPADPVLRVIDGHRCAEGRLEGWGGAIRMLAATMAGTPPHWPEIEVLDCRLCLDGRFTGCGQVSPTGAATARCPSPSAAPVSMVVEAHG